MIQILTYNGKEKELKGKDVVINKLHDAQSFDEFDINIIDLRDHNIWEYNGSNNNDVNCINDFKSLSNTDINNLVFRWMRIVLFQFVRIQNSWQ